MTKVLVLNSSISGPNSVSRTLVAEIVEQLRAEHPAVEVTERDLGAAPVPHLTPETLGGFFKEAPEGAEAETRTLSDALIAELFAADLVVIGAPMYNFGIASPLKAWFDHVLRVGVTFRYSESGPVGLVTGKKAIVVETRGGLYSEGPLTFLDAQEPHLRAVLGFIGIADVSFVRAEKLAFGPDAKAESLAGARAAIAGVTGLPKAA
jgi:FMN-dependent NADH-azoreductase